jgi:hypothetical protein
MVVIAVSFVMLTVPKTKRFPIKNESTPLLLGGAG